MKPTAAPRRLSFEALPVPALHLDRYGGITGANASACEVLGEAAAGRPLLDYLRPRQTEGRPATMVLEMLLAEASAAGRAHQQCLLQPAGATPRSALLRISPDGDGGYVAVLDPSPGEGLDTAERMTLEAMAAGRPMGDVISGVIQRLEMLMPGCACSVLSLEDDSQTVRHVAGDSLPADYREAFNGMRIGPRVGSCGTAMWHQEMVITEDIENDARWAPFRPLTRSAGLRSCWSMPILASSGQVLGSLAVYWPMPAVPDEPAECRLRRFARLLGFAMERDRDAHRLRQSEAVFRSAFERAAIGMAHLARDGRILKVNGPLCELLGYGEGELRRHRVPELVHPDERARVAEAGQRIASGEHETLQTELRLLRADGETVWASVAAAPVYSGKDEVERLVAVVSDISRSRELADELAYRATHDWLTGLYNRFELERQLAQWLGRRPEARSSAAFMQIDLDQFRLVNDSAGRAAGDALLRRAAELIRETVGERAVLARLAGDEYAMLLPDTSPEEAVAAAEGLRQAIEAAGFEWEGRHFRISASIGFVRLPERSLRSVDGVLQAGDTACATAKEAGRNRVAVWDRKDVRIDRRHGDARWVPLLIEALENGSFRLEAQPIVPVDTSSPEPARYELLVRMEQEGEWVPPGRFLPAAERYGIAPQIDRWVVEQAIAWLEARPSAPVRLAVNLSGLSVTHREFHRFVMAALADHPQAAARLCFEITETAAIADIDEARALIAELRRLGCELALDDFGSGLSSFGYLQHLPVDLLKIDGSFVRDIGSDPVSRAFVKAIADIARVMNKRTIAEFVEDGDVVAVLRELGVDFAQGYWIGKPAPLATLCPPAVRGRAASS
ncbi:sensor domain-containing protein [Spiribacter halobius]|uniref:sensor domain-containing protein n=1 Tax=Sediminicurvatus halobius TaxID=2182432 RepID=UPI001304B8BF|nr:EAL domain-containing protein [Spiribacter halobius]UEX79391.1 EAL domain-containing protein [Spiribacter halobius]